MRRVTTAALAAIVLLLGLIGAGASAATAPPRASVGGVSSAVTPSTASPHCEYRDGIGDCSSANPSVSLFLHHHDDTSSCRFQFTVDWNDGTPAQTIAVSGGPPGYVQFAEHTYTFAANNPKYTISTKGSVVSGGCSVTGGSVTFTYLSCDSSHVSGPSWASQFPDHKDLSELDDTFEPKVRAFLAAMARAGISTDVLAVLRPKERAYLMHWSVRISKGRTAPENVPPMPNVNICWVHYTADGQPDKAASIAGAQAMPAAFGLDRTNTDEPALDSRHVLGLGIDFTASWSANSVTIDQADGTPTVINTAPHSEVNRQLIAVGATYGVIHRLAIFADRHHWSDNGH